MAAKLEHATLVTTATTADQVILTVTLAAPFKVLLMALGAALTTYNATESNLGLARIQMYTGAWAQKFEQRFQNTDLDNNAGMSIISLGAGITFATGENLRAICTPGAATSMRWPCSMWGEA